MYFRILHDEVGGSISYLLGDLEAREAVLIDPRGADLPVLNAMLAERELRLRWVLRTHEHDQQHTGELVTLSGLAAPIVQGTVHEGLHPGVDNEFLPFGNEMVRVVATPGHTLGCLSFAWRDRLFCGGLLAVDACPTQAIPAEPQTLWESVTRRIFTLPDEMLLFAGHARRARAVSTVLEQRHWNPFFAGLSRDEFLSRIAALLPRLTDGTVVG